VIDEVIWTWVKGLEGLFGEGGLKGEFPGSEPNRRGKIFSAVFHAQQDYFDVFPTMESSSGKKKVSSVFCLRTGHSSVARRRRLRKGGMVTLMVSLP